MQIHVKKIHPTAVIPEYQSAQAAGLDLHALSSGTLAAHDTKLIGTGLAVEIQRGMVGLVCSRSGLAVKHSVFVLNAPGIIDSDYRGEIGVILHNAGRDKWSWAAGDRIAQLVLMPVSRSLIRVVSALSETDRGADGFGSTGVR